LRETIRKKAKALVLFGEAQGLLKSSLSGTVPIWETKDLEEAVRKAWFLARDGDVVLLSPACASFDLFIDYIERGRCFKEIVKELAISTLEPSRSS
jgi:UDP-N-acetylmuramoylalanine--D-glutamate ligase